MNFSTANLYKEKFCQSEFEAASDQNSDDSNYSSPTKITIARIDGAAKGELTSS